MKLLYFLPLLLWLPALSAQTDADFSNLIEGEQKAFSRGGQNLFATDRSGGDGQVDLQYGRFRWTVDPAVRYISGDVYYQFTPQKNLSNWTLDLTDSLTVNSVKWHGQSITFTRPGADRLVIQFPQARPVGQPDSVEIVYQGVPASTGFGSFIVSTHSDTPILWTLSEPFGARDWFPCHQYLNDKIDSCDVFITAPVGNHPASNGVLVSETTSNGQTTAHWRTRYPIATYLLCMGVTNYASYEEQVLFDGTTTKIVNYVFPENLNQAKTETPVVGQEMLLYDSLFGVYPFHEEKYGHAQFRWGGGMEHQTMTFVINFGFELLGHELAHHWFGDKVTCGSWEDIWLNEGFATYLAGLCYEHLQPQGWLPYWRIRLDGVISQPGGSVKVDDTTNVNRIFSGRLSYSKGGLILRQLRWILGDAAFFAGLRAYVQDPALAYNYARTPDLIQHLEQASGRDLSDYFARWYYGEGFPSYTVTWSQNASNQVSISLDQSTSMPSSVSFFPLPVPVRLFNNAGQDTLLVLDNTFSGQIFSAQLNFHADSLAFDPGMWLISGYNIVQSTTATGELPNAVLNNWQVSPNPGHDRFNLTLDARKAANIQTLLVSGDGKTLLTQHHAVQPGTNTFSLDVNGLAAGVYTLVLQGEGWRVAKAVVVE